MFTLTQVERELCWLVRNQDQSSDLAPSRALIERRDPSSNSGQCMSDAAAAHAVLAPVRANHP